MPPLRHRLSCIPDCEAILRKIIRSLRPGGRIVVVDSFLNRGRWYFPLTNLINRTKGILLQARPDNGMRAVMRDELELQRGNCPPGHLFHRSAARVPVEMPSARAGDLLPLSALLQPLALLQNGFVELPEMRSGPSVRLGHHVLD